MLEFMKLVSEIFNEEIMFPFLLLVSIILFVYKKRSWDLLLLSSGLITMTTVYILKVTINKPRPENMLIEAPFSSSFPSGHSAIAAVFTVLVIYAINLQFKKAIYRNTFLAKYRYVICTFVFAIFLLIPISRLYLHVHDIYDVTAGYGIGLVVTTLCVKYSHRFFKRKDY